MSKEIRISVPAPCHENWDQMTPVEQGRFCGSCQKEVVDFTSMTDAQLVAYFKKPASTSTCGRFFNDQLEREINIPRKRMPWLRHFFQIVIPALLFSFKASGQGAVVLGRIAPKAQIADGAKQVQMPAREISSQLTDSSGAPVPFASVMIKGTKQGVVTDETGRFSIKLPKDKQIILSFSAVGFISHDVDPKQIGRQVIMTRDVNEMMLGEVVVTYAATIKGRYAIIGQSLSKVKGDVVRKDASESKQIETFNVFPNPANAGGMIRVDWTKGAGDYKWELTDIAGSLVANGMISIIEKNAMIRIDLPMVPAGAYVLNFIGKKQYATKIVIRN